MTFKTRYAPLIFAIACALPVSTQAATAPGDAVPPEVLQAIDAANQAAVQSEGMLQQGAKMIQDTGSALKESASDLIEAAAGPSDVETVNPHFLAVGLGAIGGVVAFNLLTGGLASLPMLASGSGALAIESTVAASRVYAVTSATVGGLVGDYIYRRSQAGSVPSVPGEVAQRLSP